MKAFKKELRTMEPEPCPACGGKRRGPAPEPPLGLTINPEWLSASHELVDGFLFVPLCICAEK